MIAQSLITSVPDISDVHKKLVIARIAPVKLPPKQSPKMLRAWIKNAVGLGCVCCFGEADAIKGVPTLMGAGCPNVHKVKVG